MPNIRQYRSPYNAVEPSSEPARNLAAAGRAKGEGIRAMAEAVRYGTAAIGRGVSAVQSEWEKNKAEGEAAEKDIIAAQGYADEVGNSTATNDEWGQLLKDTGDDYEAIKEKGDTFLAEKEAEIQARLDAAKGTPEEPAAIRRAARERAELYKLVTTGQAEAGGRAIVKAADEVYAHSTAEVTKNPGNLDIVLDRYLDFKEEMEKNPTLTAEQQAKLRADREGEKNLVEVALGTEAERNPDGFIAMLDAGAYDKYNDVLQSGEKITSGGITKTGLEALRDKAEAQKSARASAAKAQETQAKQAKVDAGEKELGDVLISSMDDSGKAKVPDDAFQRLKQLLSTDHITPAQFKEYSDYLTRLAAGDKTDKDNPAAVDLLHTKLYAGDLTETEVWNMAVDGEITEKTAGLYIKSLAARAKEGGSSDFLSQGRTAVSKAFDLAPLDQTKVFYSAQEIRTREAYQLWLPAAIQHYLDAGIPEAELYDPQSPNYIVNKFNPGYDMPLPGQEGGVDKFGLSKQPYEDTPRDGGASPAPGPKIDPSKIRLKTKASMEEEGQTQLASFSFTNTLYGGDSGEGDANIDTLKNYTPDDQLRVDQVAFVVHELNTSPDEGAARAAFKRATSIPEAVDAALKFERPSIPHRDARIKAAYKIYNGQGNAAENVVYEALQEEGMPPIAAAGMAGSLAVEGLDDGVSMNPMASGDNGRSRGIAQWQGPRQTAALAFIKARQAERGGRATTSSNSVGYLKTKLESGKDASHITELEPVMQDRLSAFLQAADEAGIDITIKSGHRSITRQRELWKAALKKYGSASEARKWVAPPGNSQHNHGTAADLGYGGSEKAVKWAHANAKKYHLKFPLGNENWHIEPEETRGGVEV